MSTQSASKTRWLPLLILALGTFAAGTDNFMLPGVLSGIATDLHISVSTAGQFVTGYSIAYALGAPIVMTTVRVRSPRRMLLAAMVSFVLVNIVAALAHDAATMAAARLVTGCLGGVYSPLAAATAAAMVPFERKGRALAMILGGTSAATVVGVPLGVWIANHASWRVAFVLVAVLAAIAVAGIAISAPATGEVPVVSLRERIAPLRQPAVLLALGTTLTALALGFLVYTYIEPLFAEQPGVGHGAVGPLLLVLGIGAVVGVWFGSVLVDRFGAAPIVLGSLVIFAAQMALLGLSSRTLVTAGIAMAVWGLAGWAFTPAQQHSMIASARPELAPILLSLNGSAMYVGIAAGSAMGGAVTAALGAGWLWLFATVFAVIALALVLAQHRLQQ